ncbi:MAG: hypothetical protein U0840_30005 [Gemmataceae bacterium]
MWRHQNIAPRIGDPADLAPGLHSKTLVIGTAPGQIALPGVGAGEIDADYYLLAVADPRNVLVENDGLLYFADNTTTVAGAYLGTDRTLFVHGRSGADRIRLSMVATYQPELDINGVSMPFDADSVTAIRVRSHTGDDWVDGSAVAYPIWIKGGDGNDTLIGGGLDDYLDGGNGADILTGGSGTNRLIGGAGADRLVETGTTTFVVNNGKLVFSGTDNLTGIERAELTGTAGAVFDVSGWTGSGGLFAPSGGSVVVMRNSNFTLSDTSLVIAGSGGFTLSGITTANLVGGAAGNGFNLSGWTGGGTLSGGGGSDTLVIVKDADFVLTDTQVQTTDGMSMVLASNSLRTARLAGGAGGNVFDIGGWTGSISLTGNGGTDTVAATRNSGFVLTNQTLQIGAGPIATLIGISDARLSGGAGNNVFTVGGWTGSGMLTGGGGNDTLSAVKNSNLILTDSSLSAGDGLTLGIAPDSGLRRVVLVGGAGNNRFDVGGWTGSGTINGSTGTDTIVVSKNQNLTLSNSALSSSDGLAITLASIEAADLSGGDGDNTIDAAGFFGSTRLAGGGGSDVLKAGRGNSILAGGTGDDLLYGNLGRDFLIGGFGADTLSGGAGDDILLAGQTTHEDFRGALDALMAEWARTAIAYGLRIKHLFEGVGGLNGSVRLGTSPPATVRHDGESNILGGGTGLDWFLADIESDSLLDLNSGGLETVT